MRLNRSRGEVAAKVKNEGNKLAGQNRERMQTGMQWFQYGVTKFLSRGSRRGIMLSQVRHTQAAHYQASIAVCAATHLSVCLSYAAAPVIGIVPRYGNCNKLLFTTSHTSKPLECQADNKLNATAMLRNATAMLNLKCKLNATATLNLHTPG